MTRPQIIRAGAPPSPLPSPSTPAQLAPPRANVCLLTDTLDLQDKTSPTAQDHSRQPEHPAPLGVGPAAPHQQASLRSVDEERTSEEAHLHNGANWANNNNNLRDDPGSDDEQTMVTADKDSQQDETAVRLNGGMTGDGDDADMQDADVEEDMDDDMMDKISSSPSIDDGGYSLPCYPQDWPEDRGASSTPDSSPIHSPMASFDSSSPFTTTPVHYPLSLAAARRPFQVPASGPDPTSPSSYHSPPTSYAFSTSSQTQSADHHRGEYSWPRAADRSYDSTGSGDAADMSPRSAHLTRIEARLQLRLNSDTSLSSELDEEETRRRLQPLRSPLQDSVELAYTIAESVEGEEAYGHLLDEDDESCWTTDSDLDSCEADPNYYDDDDDSKDVLFSDDPRFIDSGWGGECLQETEDIDFEFVYALHTFVATVEGQANATKGDAMVLLDDSNSYWWLVRVVKDSSIGKSAAASQPRCD